METYAYLALGVGFSIVWLPIFVFRRDLRITMLISGVVGAGGGLLAEFWYLQDYWHPPSIAGTFVPWPEDLLYGFMLMGVSVTIYDVLFCQKNISKMPPRFWVLPFLFLTGVGSLWIGSTLLGWNSIFIAMGFFLVTTVLFLILRKDLLIPALVTSMLSVALMFLIYLSLHYLGFLTTAYLESYWLLSGTRAGALLLGVIPLTEFLWYATWGLLAGVVVPVITGSVKKPL